MAKARCSPEHVIAKLMEMSKVCSKRWPADEAKCRELMEPYVRYLTPFEAVAVTWACEEWPRHRKAWPLPSDLVNMIERTQHKDPEIDAGPVDVDGGVVRQEAITLLGPYCPHAKGLLGDHTRPYREFLAEAARIWGKVRPLGGLDELAKVKGSRRIYGTALEAWARAYLQDRPLHVDYATLGVADMLRQMTGDEIAFHGTPSFASFPGPVVPPVNRL